MADNHFEKIYPIGKYVKSLEITSDAFSRDVNEISTLPQKMNTSVLHLNDMQLDTTYRENGWTIRQVVHHCADSHMNAFIRTKLALTENAPTIKPYNQNLWCELYDSSKLRIESSLMILDGIHQRWVALLNSLTPEQIKREFYHPELEKTMSIFRLTHLYAWHGNHHNAQIVYLLKVKGWI